MTPRLILDETYKLLSDGWIQGSCACKADGEVVRFDDPRAKAFCLMGAFFRASSNLQALTRESGATDAFDKVEAALDGRVGPGSLWEFNDHKKTTREDVLRLVDEVRSTFQ